MANKGTLTQILAIGGTVLVWIPILMPVFFSAVRFAQARRLLFDFLMPAEVFPIVLVGAALLIWAALRARSRRGLVLWSFGLALAGLGAAVGLAEVLGLASGETEAAGPPLILVLAFFVLFWLGLIGTAVAGVLLWRDLAKKSPSPAPLSS